MNNNIKCRDNLSFWTLNMQQAFYSNYVHKIYKYLFESNECCLSFRLAGKISKYRYVNISYYYKFMLRYLDLCPWGCKGGKESDGDSANTTTIKANTNISVIWWWNQIVFNFNKFE